MMAVGGAVLIVEPPGKCYNDIGCLSDVYLIAEKVKATYIFYELN